MKKLGLKAGLQVEWDSVVARGRCTLFEFNIGENDWLEVNLNFLDLKVNGGLYFEFDLMDYPTFFSGNVKKYQSGYYIPFCKYNESLQYYLEECYNELVEGFLIPNQLDYFLE